MRMLLLSLSLLLAGGCIQPPAPAVIPPAPAPIPSQDFGLGSSLPPAFGNAPDRVADAGRLAVLWTAAADVLEEDGRASDPVLTKLSQLVEFNDRLKRLDLGGAFRPAEKYPEVVKVAADAFSREIGTQVAPSDDKLSAEKRAKAVSLYRALAYGAGKVK